MSARGTGHVVGSSGLQVRSSVRTLMASAAIAAAVALAGCETDGLQYGKAMREISPEMQAELIKRNMPKESSVLVRLFKQEAELELWKQDASGRYELLKTYPICRWSGELGPKVKEGDRQAPEGFYTITPAQMNPNSQFYLSFNMGYPNAYDKAWGRTGAHLMVHGDCSSRGCYAMTDDQIGEIYALARESFFGGQRSFQVQAYPFRMTPANFAKHRNNPHIPFWKMLKEGSDHFEITRQEPKIDVCEKRYVFNAEAPAQNATPTGILLGTPWGTMQQQNPQASLKFNPTGKCPVYQVPAEVVAEVAAKRRTDEQQTAQLISRGVTAAPIRTGRDGGMHPTFLAKLKPKEVREADGTVRYVVDANAAKTLGSYVSPPLETHGEPVTTGTAVAEATPVPRAAPQPKTGAPASTGTYVMAAADTRSAPPPARTENGMFSNLFSSSNGRTRSGEPDSIMGRVSTSVTRLFGMDDDKKPAPQAAPVPKPAAKPQPTPTAKPKAEPQPQAQAMQDPVQANPAPRPAANASLVNGATAAPVPAGSFDARWGAIPR
jgi:murein L,D-transpeptidase YafK